MTGEHHVVTEAEVKAAASQGTSRIMGNSPESGKRQGKILASRLQGEHGLAKILDSDF